MALAIRDEVIEELLQGYSSPQDLLGEEGLFKELKRRLLERALGGELTEHLGYERCDPAGRGSGNSRNGYSNKTVIGDDGAIEIAVPRDRNSSFEPQIVAKGQTRLDGFDDRIISLYARGLSVREIQAHLQELYGVEVSPDLISRITDGVLEEVREWQNRPLDPLYPVIGRAWEYVVPLFAFPSAIRKMIYTTNAVESPARSLRKIIKTRGSFPTDEAALKLLFLAIRNAGVKWRRRVEWTAAMAQFSILFGDRFEPSAR